MSPRRGGEADKFGNRYESRWTVHHLLQVLHGQIDSMTIEKAGEAGEGVEFTLRRGSKVEVHQVKRQTGTANGWSVRSLANAGVFCAAQRHVAAGREFHFVSIVPARRLDELTDRARRTATVQEFETQMITKKLEMDFRYLSSEKVLGSSEAAWRTLQGMYIRCTDERHVCDVNNAFADTFISGATPPTATAALADLVLDNLNVELNATALEARLDEYGLSRAQLFGSPTLVQAVQEVSQQWRDGVIRELLRPELPRVEAAAAWDKIRAGNRTLFVVGAAGVGKTATVNQIVKAAMETGWKVLAFRLDRVVNQFSSPTELGQHLNLGISPTAALAAMGSDTQCLLVIDQVDAVSMASGRMPQSFEAIAGLMREASGFPNMHVVLACRKFDVENDERIRAVMRQDAVSRVEVGPLSDDQVDTVLRGFGLDPASLMQSQRRMLSSPFNLVLLRAIADKSDVLSFRSDRDLLDAYWDRKLRDCRGNRSPAPRFNEVVARLVDAMSEDQRLSVPITVLDSDDLADDARVLESEHVIIRDGRQYAFFHERFFGYAFARRWVERRQTLVDFLSDDRQELFRRGQVREILNYIHDDEPDRFISEVEDLLLSDDIRFHIKDVVLSVLRELDVPTSSEWEMVSRVIATRPEFIDRLWLTLRTLPWFDRLDAEGKISAWLQRDATVTRRALDVALGVAKDRTDRIAQLIAPFATTDAEYPNWLRWIARFAELHRSRPLLDLVIESVRRGEYVEYEHDLWMSAYRLAEYEPIWAVDLLSAYFVGQPNALDLNGRRVKLLDSREHALIELTQTAARKAPREFCDALLPYIQDVLSATEVHTERLPVMDLQFSVHHWSAESHIHNFEEALLHGARTALLGIVRLDPLLARTTLDRLAEDRHKTALWLLYVAVQEAPQAYAEWAAGLLAEEDWRLLGDVETTANLLRAITPYLHEDLLTSLEQVILKLRFSWESRSDHGVHVHLLSALPAERLSYLSSRRLPELQHKVHVFHLLSALPAERLSYLGSRRLAELRRRFNTDQPRAQPFFSLRKVESPIPPEAAKHMKDKHWLRALVKYRDDRKDWTTMRGGARELSGLPESGAYELSRLLQSEATADPDRFARLALCLTPDMHPAYADGILIGLGNVDTAGSPDLVFDAIRHIASLGHPENDRWLAWPLRKHLDSPIPDDIIQLLISRVLSDARAHEDHWEESEKRDGLGELIVSNGINSARGSCAQMLGDIVVHDSDGHRTDLVASSLAEMANDSSVTVLSCVAHLIAACLRHDQATALTAFGLLVRADDRLFTTDHVTQLMIFVGNIDSLLLKPLIERMLASSYEEVRKTGGQFAAFGGLELGLVDLIEEARKNGDAATRAGVAMACAHRLSFTSNAALACDVLQDLMEDPDEKVRETVAEMAGALRNTSLDPFRDVLMALINSAAFEPAADQLIYTLGHTTDRIDDLTLACVRRFIDVFGLQVNDLSISAGGNTGEVGRLVLRAYEQARNPDGRSSVLDLIDKLLLFSAFGVDELVVTAES